MKLTDLCDDVIHTYEDGGTFNISISGESAHLEDVIESLTYELTREEARELLSEIHEFLNKEIL